MSPCPDRLSELDDGETAVVTGFDPALPAARRERLEDLGLIPETPVTRRTQAPLGDPVAFVLRGGVLCLRRGVARLVRVRRGRR